LQTTTIIIAMKLLLSALVGISVIKLGTGNNMLEGFEYVGVGYCKDSAGEWYSSFGHVLDDANDNDCMQYCTQVEHPDFVGVDLYDYGDGRRDCLCGFSGGLPQNVTVNSYSPNALYSSSYYGAGPVQSSDGTSGVSCYRYTVSLFLVKLCLDVHSHCFQLKTQQLVLTSISRRPLHLHLRYPRHPLSHLHPQLALLKATRSLVQGGAWTPKTRFMRPLALFSTMPMTTTA
jgi:hypothetical protein